ncbi:MAG: hypothetical protein POELPBGB_02419 [Bacteroidia bacterium]|nr:hypothetical protein [Bacteroidia bacterium]
MKKLSLLTAIMLFTVQTLFSQELDWAYSIKHSSVQNYATRIAGNGNYFVIAGAVTSGVNLDFINGNSAHEAANCFVAKYNSNAEIQWEIEQPGGGFNQYVFDVFIDNDGNVFTAGNFGGTVDFDPTATTANYTASGDDSFLQKLDANGNLVWVAHAKTDAIASRIARKSNGNFLIAGRSQVASTTTLTNGNTVNLDAGLFILEISASGDVIGAYSMGIPSSFSTLLTLAVDNNDNVIIATAVDGNVDLDLGAGTLTDASNSAYDVVLVKYNSSFQYQWHKLFGDVPQGQPGGWEAVTGIETDATGNIYATGYFTWTTDFDPDANPGTFVLTAGTGSQTPDGFIIKYNPQGEIQWVTDAGTHPDISGNTDVNFLDMILSGDQIIVSGTLNGGADFDGSPDTSFLLTFDNGLALCYATYTTSGEFENAWLIDGIVSANESHSGIAPTGNGFVAYGTFQKKCDMDPTDDTYLLYTDSTGSYYNADNDVFVAKYELDGNVGLAEKTIEDNTLHVFPNPSNTVFNVLLDKTGETYLLELSDITGKRLAAYTIGNTANRIAIPTANLESGVYFLSLRSLEGALLEVKKLISSR